MLPPGEHAGPPPADEGPGLETVTEPAKVMRIGSMVKQLLDEVRGEVEALAGSDELHLAVSPVLLGACERVIEWHALAPEESA